MHLTIKGLLSVLINYHQGTIIHKCMIKCCSFCSWNICSFWCVFISSINYFIFNIFHHTLTMVHPLWLRATANSWKLAAWLELTTVLWKASWQQLSTSWTISASSLTEKASNAKSSPSADYNSLARSSSSAEEHALAKLEPSLPRKVSLKNSQRAHSEDPLPSNKEDRISLISRDIKFWCWEENSQNLPGPDLARNDPAIFKHRTHHSQNTSSCKVHTYLSCKVHISLSCLFCLRWWEYNLVLIKRLGFCCFRVWMLRPVRCMWCSAWPWWRRAGSQPKWCILDPPRFAWKFQ